jgi:hypothetical protein
MLVLHILQAITVSSFRFVISHTPQLNFDNFLILASDYQQVGVSSTSLQATSPRPQNEKVMDRN